MINALFLRFAHTLGIRDKKETVIRWASTSKPALGGISFFIVFLLSLAAYSMFFESQPILRHKDIAGLMATASMAFIMGLADDAYNTRPLLKLFVQVLCGLVLCYSGIYIRFFDSMVGNYLLTILWTVGMMNSLNMLDNMDAIATVVSIFIFAASALSVYHYVGAQHIHFFILTGLTAALLGFLVFNWHPSKLFMGDTGSQLIGLMLAAMGIQYFWNVPGQTEPAPELSRQLMLVFITFILPIADTSIVVFNRIMERRSPFIGGRDHTTHFLFFRGVTEKRVALLFSLIGIISCGLVYMIHTHYTTWSMEEFSLLSIFPFTIMFGLFAVTRLKKNILNPGTPSNPDASRNLTRHAEKHLS